MAGITLRVNPCRGGSTAGTEAVGRGRNRDTVFDMQRLWVVWMVGFGVGCGGGNGGVLDASVVPDIGPIDAGDGAPDGPPDGSPDGPADAAIDAAIDADPNALAIATVATADGFTQICHGCVEEVVVTGSHLDTATSIQLGSISGTITSTAAGELRGSFEIPAGFTPGALALTVIGGAGTATRPAAIEITVKVLSPSAVVGSGHATPQSPMQLCDPELSESQCGACVHSAKASDTVHLLAGDHVCIGQSLTAGIILEGVGIGATTVASQNGMSFGAGSTTTVKNLSFVGPAAFPSVRTSQSGLIVQNVEDVGGIVVTEGNAEIDNYSYDAPGAALLLQLETQTATITNTTIRNCATGIFLQPTTPLGGGGTFTIDDTVIEHCDVGLRIGEGPSTFSAQSPTGTSSALQLLDNTFGIIMAEGSVRFTNLVIHDNEATLPAVTTGIFLGNGDVFLTGGEIIGQTTGVEVSSSADTFPAAFLDGVSVVGGQVGVRARSQDDFAKVTVRRSTVRDQSVAAMQIEGGESSFDLGTAGDPGANTLSVVSGFALDDNRASNISPLFELLDARGTTLNGTSYTGQLLQGPLTIGSDIRIRRDDAAWQF